MIGAVVLAWWLGIYAIFFGVALLVAAWRLRERHMGLPGSGARRRSNSSADPGAAGSPPIGSWALPPAGRQGPACQDICTATVRHCGAALRDETRDVRDRDRLPGRGKSHPLAGVADTRGMSLGTAIPATGLPAQRSLRTRPAQRSLRTRYDMATTGRSHHPARSCASG